MRRLPHDVSRRKELFPKTPTGREHWTLAPKETTGDGITMAQAVGARFETDVESPAAWCPVSLVPYRNGRTGTFPHIMDRAKPGSIGVRRDGKRFVNEANGYYDYVEGLINATPEGEPVEAWQIADAAFVRKFPLGMAKPLPVPLFPYLRSGYLKKGNTLEELAAACGIDPQGLAETVAEFNVNARKGIDPDFDRGASEFNRYGGDPKNTPNPSLRPLDKGPFYAVRIVPDRSVPSPDSRPIRVHGFWTTMANPSAAFTSRAMTRPQSWAGTTRPGASISAQH